MLRGLFWSPTPGPSDPVHQITSPPSEVRVQGRIVADARTLTDACSALISIDQLDQHHSDGRIELLLRPCERAPEQGWKVEISGLLRHPPPSPHPTLEGSRDRLQREQCWSQIRAESMVVLQQPWTPFADLRRRIARRLQAVAGQERGGLLAALTVGSAQVQLPAAVRDAFRVAGLSHTLAASGFHLSVLLGVARSVGRRTKNLQNPLAVSALAIFLCLAGAQASVVRAVLMGSTTLLIRQTGERSRAVGVLTFTLIVMLAIHPAWARSIGFQFSAAATAGLILSAPALEHRISHLLPKRLNGLAAAISIPLAALTWTLPLQLLHFGSTPLYAVPANVLAAPLLTPLTVLAMVSALLSLVAPLPVLTLLVWPVQHLAGWLIGLANLISSLPAAQILTGHPHPLVALLFLIALLPWVLPQARRWRFLLLPCAMVSVGFHTSDQFSDELVAGHRYGRHWLLARHNGRGAMVSSHGDERSCLVARRLSHVHGHRHLDWVYVLNRIPHNASDCWRQLAPSLHSNQSGIRRVHPGQTLLSPGLSLALPSDKNGAMELRAGNQRLLLLPSIQTLWNLQDQKRDFSSRLQAPMGLWVGFWTTRSQRSWLSSLQEQGVFVIGLPEKSEITAGRGSQK
ncbi:ComEC/Rec2 family competence protein [Synechococcus sp. MIT S1220]|uniref:ComEC/Rec2 family competence protein n=1 Tax=Synechococcus sp. MIT S1220 TaxID=3082549 RepID=UPI0039AF2D9B